MLVRLPMPIRLLQTVHLRICAGKDSRELTADLALRWTKFQLKKT